MTEQKHTPSVVADTRPPVDLTKQRFVFKRLPTWMDHDMGLLKSQAVIEAQDDFREICEFTDLREDYIDAIGPLIAAAPDLLEVAIIDHVLWSIGYTEKARRELTERGLHPPASWLLGKWQQERRQAAIAKATGGAGDE